MAWQRLLGTMIALFHLYARCRHLNHPQAWEGRRTCYRSAVAAVASVDHIWKRKMVYSLLTSDQPAAQQLHIVKHPNHQQYQVK